MFMTHLWRRAVKRPASDYLRAVAPGAVRQAVRTLGQSLGSGTSRRLVLFLRRAAPSPRSPWRSAVAALVVLTALLACTIPAAAQPATEFAGNVGQPQVGGVLSGVLVDTDISQRFTTGSNSDGYSLKYVGIRTEGSIERNGIDGVHYVVADYVCTGNEERVTDCPLLGNRFSVFVCSVLTSGYPDRSACTRLNPPSSFEVGWKIFTAQDGIDAEKVFLAPNTTYTLLMRSGNQLVVYGITDSDEEDGTSPPGWSIWNNYEYYSYSNYEHSPYDGTWTPHPTQALRIQIHFTTGIPNAVITSIAVTSTPPSDSYGSGDIIEFTVTFHEAVTVVGEPLFNFSLGEVAKTASYDAARSTTTSLVFRYTVQTGDEDTDGIWVGSGPQTFTLDADDHIRTTMSGIDALLDHNEIGTLSGHKVKISSDATLRALTLSGAADDSPIALSPVFESDTTSYTAAVAHGVDKLTVEPTTTHARARVAYLDASDAAIPDADAVQTGQQVALTVGMNTITVQVTAETVTTTQPYTVTVTRAGVRVSRAGVPPPPLSSDATLRGLALSGAADDSPIALSPVFESDTTSYTAAVAHGVDKLTVEPTTTHARARVAYLDASDAAIPDADAVQTGQQVALTVGMNTITVQVTAETVTTTQPYTVTVTRGGGTPPPLSSDATLRGLALSNAADDSPITLSPVFESDTTSYTAAVAHGVDKLTVEPTTTHARARVAYLDASDAAIPNADLGQVGHQVALTVGETTIKGRVTAENGTPQPYTVVVSRADVPPPPPQGREGSGGSGARSGGGSSGGGGGSSRDDHGNTPARATPVTLDPARMAATAGQLNTPDDVDYFTVAVPQAGTLVVETTGRTNTVGTVWQDGEEVATDANSGARRNFRLRVRVEAGPVVIAVAGTGTRTGAYTLQTTLLVGYLENPGADAFQSGIGVISGWVCEAEEVEIELNGVLQIAAYGTARADTEAVCDDTDNGFGLLFNWNLLGDGEHEVVAFVDGVELGRATVTVTTLGEEFLRDVTGTCEVADFPSLDESMTLVWQQPQQNFVIVDGAEPNGENRAGRAGVGYLENPSPNAFQSGIGVISGWVCEADAVEIEIGALGTQLAGYGTERLDTQEVCGDTNNGFGLLFNWNLLSDGEHEVVTYADEEELGRATVRVTTLSEEFVQGVEGECVVEDFPDTGQRVTLAWQQNRQNFVITDVQ